MFKNVFRKCRQNRGFTLMEVMVVVAILAVVVLIAVPSVIKMRQNMKFAERNDYAKSIYMAAQSNLTQMRSMGELGLLEQAAKDDDATKGIPSDVNSADFYCSSSEGSSASYNLIVPSSIDSTIRNQKVIVEYNPIIGVVYSVFYYEGNDSLKSKYESGIERDNEAFLKESQIGYYSVDKIDVLNADDAFKIYQLESTITFDNTQQGIITVDVPAQYTAEGTPKNLLADDPECTRYMQSMEVKLSISGENGGSFTTTIKAKDEPGFTEKCYVIQAAGAVKTIRIKVPIDSLTDGSFSQIADNKKDSDNFNSPPAIAPGDNVTITANVTFHPSAKDDIIMIESATIAGINPMYHSLTPNPKFDTAPNAQNTEKPYILAVSNGRHLQNLSYLDAEFAQNIESIVFTQQAEDPVQPENGSTEGSTSESQPANGAKTSTNTGSQENNTPAELKLDWAKTVEAYSSTLTFQPIEFEDFTYVPSILGNGVKIQNLTVSSAVDGNAGLFAALKNTSVEKITLENPIVNATGATSTGALIGTAENVSISDCDVITKNTGDIIHYYISGQGNVGGLVGTATGTGSTNTISNCSSVAVVRSADGSKSNVGGLVGSSDGTDYTNCGSSATVRGGAYDDTTNYSYLGGLVGLAKNANFNSASSSASVKGTNALNDSGNYIPQSNYIGGLIGRAESCNFVSDVSANLTDLPAYAYGAGGLVGWMKGGRISAAGATLTNNAETTENTVVRFGGLAAEFTDGVNIATDQNQAISVNIKGDLCGDSAAGAIVGISGSSCVIENIEVTIDGAIRGNAAAGFAIEAGGTIDNCCVDAGSESNIIAHGTNTSAGFTTTNYARITNSYVRGNVVKATDGSAAGFVYENKGSINRSMANVTVGDKYAFVRTNDHGSVKDCYGWLWDNDSTSALKIDKDCSYSYFVNGKTDAMVLYVEPDDNKKSIESNDIINTDALSDQWAVRILNEGTPSGGTAAWENPHGGYDYPELVGLSHKGKTKDPTGGNYSYGVLYVETYSDNSYGVYMTDISNADTKKTADTLSNEKTISRADYYVYHRTATEGNSGISVDQAKSYNSFGELGLNQLYSIYPVTDNDVKVGGDSIPVNTKYGPKDGDVYRIRTATQFGNITGNSSFRIEKSMEVSGTISSFSGTMTASSNVVIDASQLTQAMIGELKGSSEKEAKLSGLAVEGLKAPLVATVNNGGKIENCTLTKVNIPSGENVGAFAGTLEGGTISGGSAEGSVSGSNYVGGAIGYVKSGTVSGVTNVNVAVSATGENTKAGMFVGYAEGGSFTNCHSTAKSTGLPFGQFATVQLSSATHKSKYSVTDKILVSNFDNYSPVGDNIPETITIKVENCSFNNGQPALRSSEDYYYIVDTSKYQFEKGTPLSMTMVTADAKDITYEAVKSLCDESESSPVQTDYFIISGSAYYHVYASVSLVTDDASTDSEEKYTFTLTANNKSVFTKTITQKELGNKIPDDSNAPTFYKIGYYESDAYCRGGGYYLIHGGSSLGYLTYDSTEGIKWGGNADSESSLWIGDEKGGWKNYINESAIITIKAESIQEDGFLGLVSIKFENKDIDPYYSSEFFTCYVALYYGCSALGNTYEVNYPTT